MHTDADPRQMTVDPLLGALALGDSALPIGRFVHSGGLEAWLGERPASPAGAVARADAHGGVRGRRTARRRRPRARAPRGQPRAADRTRPDPDRSQADTGLPQSITRLRAAAGGTRAPSRPADKLVREISAAVRDRRTDGNLAVIEGTLARALGATGTRRGANRAAQRRRRASVGRRPSRRDLSDELHRRF